MANLGDTTLLAFYDADPTNITGGLLTNQADPGNGDLVVDNMLIQIVPTPAALPAGLAMLGMLVMRRK